MDKPYRVYFWNGALNNYTQDATFDEPGVAEDYARQKLQRFQPFVTHAKIIGGFLTSPIMIDRDLRNPILKPIARAIWSVGASPEVIQAFDKKKEIMHELANARNELARAKGSVRSRLKLNKRDTQGLTDDEIETLKDDLAQQRENAISSYQEEVDIWEASLDEANRIIKDYNKEVPWYSRRNPLFDYPNKALATIFNLTQQLKRMNWWEMKAPEAESYLTSEAKNRGYNDEDALLIARNVMANFTRERRNPMTNSYESVNAPGPIAAERFQEPLIINTDDPKVADAAWYYNSSTLQGGTYNPEKWLTFLMRYHKAHPNNKFGQSMKEASKLYKKTLSNPSEFGFEFGEEFKTKFNIGLPTIAIAALAGLYFWQKSKHI